MHVLQPPTVQTLTEGVLGQFTQERTIEITIPARPAFDSVNAQNRYPNILHQQIYFPLFNVFVCFYGLKLS